MKFLPRWRLFTWIIVVINVLFLIALIGGLASGENPCEGKVGDELDLCEAGTAVGTGIGVGIMLFFWALVDIILGVVWLITRSGRRPCPVCGTDVKKGQTVCRKCGHDFAASPASG